MKQELEFEEFAGKAIKREKRKRPRMRVHGKSLKLKANRTIIHIAKIERKKNK